MSTIEDLPFLRAQAADLERLIRIAPPEAVIEKYQYEERLRDVQNEIVRRHSSEVVTCGPVVTLQLARSKRQRTIKQIRLRQVTRSRYTRFSVVQKGGVTKVVKASSELTVGAADESQMEVQVALLTKRISELSGHLKMQPKDYSGRRWLLVLVSKRRRLLDHLRQVEPGLHNELVARLGLRK